MSLGGKRINSLCDAQAHDELVTVWGVVPIEAASCGAVAVADAPQEVRLPEMITQQLLMYAGKLSETSVMLPWSRTVALTSCVPSVRPVHSKVLEYSPYTEDPSTYHVN